ncbi:MAG: ParB/RepB/Spo0J family partition protein [Desulfosarcina sp.]|nr:ParB/RepB/Spo0J family partition protein [Desulfobacterales bacterium]
MTRKTVKTKSTPAAGGRKPRKMALGRGLDALLPGGASGTDDDHRPYRSCPIDIIRPNRYQPRRHFPEDEMAELTASIKAQGIIQPLLVRKDTIGYELVAGERRLRAAKMAGLAEVPVVIKDMTDAQLLEVSIVENIQREDFNPIEEADAYHRLMSEFGLTQDQAASRVGKSRSSVANFLRLRQLQAPIKQSIVAGTISMGHARALLGLESAVERQSTWRIIISRQLSVRETEKLIRKLKTTAKPKPASRPSSLDRHLASVAVDLSRIYGTKVSVQRKGQRGKVAIEFYNNDDLDRLISLLKQD